MKTGITALSPQLSSGSNFKLFLQAELARRCASNEQYSLRSFAVFLGVDHSTLSQLIRGKRALTEKTIIKLGERLGLKPEEIDAFVAQERVIAIRETGASREIRQLAMDAVGVLADPTHRSILELMHLDEFLPDSRWIGRVLNLSVDEINIALTRLVRLGLLEMAAHNCWLDKSEALTSSGKDFDRLAIERLLEQARKLTMIDGQQTSSKIIQSLANRLVISSNQVDRLMKVIEQLRSEGRDSLDGEYEVELIIRPVSKAE
jgi:uncharacterized protein (TIGR02147 family)